MRYLRILLAVEAIVLSVLLSWLAWDYSFGNGYGLHPLLSALGITLSGFAWWSLHRETSEASVPWDYCDCESTRGNLEG